MFSFTFYFCFSYSGIPGMSSIGPAGNVPGNNMSNASLPGYQLPSGRQVPGQSGNFLNKPRICNQILMQQQSQQLAQHPMTNSSSLMRQMPGAGAAGGANQQQNTQFSQFYQQ